MEKFKAIFVAQGFSQKEGIDYDETFSLEARYTSIRTIIAIASAMGWKLHQMDVKTAFLNGIIKEEVYIEQPEGFTIHDKYSHVCKLKKDIIWTQASTLCLVWTNRRIPCKLGIHQE